MTGKIDTINSLMDALTDLIAVIPEDVNDCPDSQAYRQVADRIKSANDTMKDIQIQSYVSAVFSCCILTAGIALMIRAVRG